MSITEHTLKLLWGDAANCCALCKRLLTEDSSVKRRTVLGEAAHIVAKSPHGPRGSGPRPVDIDGYENLILLCPDDHKVIDDRPGEFSIDWLHARKRAHCDWVKACLRTSQTPPINRSTGTDQTLLRNYGPSSWLCPPNANGPEVFIRTAIALPTPIPIPRRSEQPRETASLLEPEDREDLVVTVLNDSVLTRELRRLRKSWHWDSDLAWQIEGGAGPELTTATFRLQWASPRLRQPLALRSGVLTGWVAGNSAWQRALLVALDVSINVLELDRERRPSGISHFSTPAPAPGALRPAEFGELLSLMAAEVGPIASEVIGPLAGLEPETAGNAAAWIQHDTISLDRFIDLSGWTRLPNASESRRAETAESWPFNENSGQRGERRLGRGLLSSALRNNDYRRYNPVLDQIFGASSG